jgi:hypothetical protein
MTQQRNSGGYAHFSLFPMWSSTDYNSEKTEEEM